MISSFHADIHDPFAQDELTTPESGLYRTPFQPDDTMID
jgi:hypothetical protein